MKRICTFSIIHLILFGFLLTLTNSCNTEVDSKQLPVLTTKAITKISQNTATCGGIITSDGGLKVSVRGVCWSLQPNPTINDNSTKDDTGTSEYTSTISSLIVNTTYYVRAYATNINGTAYGLQVTFKTLTSILPELTTTVASNITVATAVSGGNVMFDGGSAVIARGVCWGNEPNPTITNNKTSNGRGNGTFSSNLTNLVSGTTYYIRAYAANSLGTAYGSQVSFRTVTIATLTTSSVTSTSYNTAICGGNIISDGGAPITERGVCWNIASNPTISNYITTNGSGIGTFISNLSGLTDGVTYYLRAYATNTAGTSYGNQVSFVTQPSYITDIDGNSYKIVNIGNQIWMADNLKVTHFRDGTTIPLVTDGTVWSTLKTAGYCWYNNSIYYYNNSNYGPGYGALYNWYTVNTGKLAPVGWHVPTDEEWTTLTTYLGGETYAGGKLKYPSGYGFWLSPNTGATNISGFSALGGGSRSSATGTFSDINYYGHWWTATEFDTNHAWKRIMYSGNASVGRGNSSEKQYGFSVRCIKD
jgi:uncharacterized protein (TIGR02145 family)